MSSHHSLKDMEAFNQEDQNEEARYKGKIAPENVIEAREAFNFVMETSDPADLMLFAVVAEQLEAYEDMVKLVKIMIEKKITFSGAINDDEDRTITLSSEERNLFSVAFSGLLSKKKASLEMYSVVDRSQGFRKVTKRDTDNPTFKGIVDSLSEEVRKHCDEFIEFGAKLNKHGCDLETSLFLKKVEADCRRYKIETRLFYEDEPDIEDINTEKQNLKEFYLNLKAEAEPLKNFNQVKLGLLNNYALFLLEIMGEVGSAISEARAAFDKGTASLLQCEGTEFNEAKIIIQVLEDNYKSWEQALEAE